MNLIEEFNDYRSKMNERILAEDNKVIKRFFNLDTNTYAEGEIDVKTKEMIAVSTSESVMMPRRLISDNTRFTRRFGKQTDVK